MTGRARRRRRGGRSARQAARARDATVYPPYLSFEQKPFEVLSEEGIEIIERNADIILERVGVDMLDEHARDVLVGAGAEAEGERLRFPGGMCRSIIQQSAPGLFTQHARNPARNVEIGASHMVLAPAYGPPFVRDLDGGRRYATIEDFRNFVKLAYASPFMHHSGGTVCEPVDLPVNKRHFDMVYSHMRLSDKPFMGSVTTPERAQDTVDMCRLLFGDEFVDDNAVVMGLINVNSPLTYDGAMAGSLRVYAENGQITLVTPFVLAGAMSPVTVAGAAAQTLAEAMVGMAYAQVLRPGAPVVFGSFGSSMSMQSGAPTFGTPEPAQLLFALAAVARRLGVPFRSGGHLCASKIPDAQAAYESAATMHPTVMAGVNFVLHAAGWLEGGLTMGYEKFVLDEDQCGMIEKFARGVDLSENAQALDTILENGPGQHFLGTAHTLANFETAFYRSPVADNNSFEQWLDEGGKDSAERANAIWKQTLADYEPPPLDGAIDEALVEYMERRKASFPDSDI